MGWSGHAGLTAREAVEFELRGTDVLKRVGNWVVWRNKSGHVGLTHFLTRRSGGRRDPYVAVKAVDITMGPGSTPPKSVVVEYLKHYDGDVEAAGGTYGADILRKALAPKAKPAAIVPGDTFTIPADEYGRTWDDGQPLAGDYVWLGKYRARRAWDGVMVRLPRYWRRAWLTPEGVEA